MKKSAFTFSKIDRKEQAEEETHRIGSNVSLTNEIASLNTKKPIRPFIIDEFNDKTIYNLISQGYTLTISNGKHLNISTRKLLIMSMIKLAAQNTHKSNKPLNTDDLKIQISIDEYIKLRGIPNTPASRKEAIKTIKKDLDALGEIWLNWKELIGGKQKSFINIRICSGTGIIENGGIYFGFGVEFGEYLLSNGYTTQYPLALFGIDERNPVAFEFLNKIAYHTGLHNNQNIKTANIISIKKLLENSSIQTYDHVMAHGGHISRDIIQRLYKGLEDLVDDYGYLREWHYCHRKSKPLTDDELKRTNDYKFFETLYVSFELQNPPQPSKVIEDKKKPPKRGQSVSGG